VATAYERPDAKALAELEQLFRHLGAEVAQWRRRSLKAEAELAQVKARGVYEGPELTGVRDRVVELENDNRQLRERIDAARERVRTLNARLAFLERGSS
jgi:predicted  nucleic acid-binding Zn-ribbon protein